jgi:hypothetical protein
LRPVVLYLERPAADFTRVQAVQLTAPTQPLRDIVSSRSDRSPTPQCSRLTIIPNTSAVWPIASLQRIDWLSAPHSRPRSATGVPTVILAFAQYRWHMSKPANLNLGEGVSSYGTRCISATSIHVQQLLLRPVLEYLRSHTATDQPTALRSRASKGPASFAYPCDQG